MSSRNNHRPVPPANRGLLEGLGLTEPEQLAYLRLLSAPTRTAAQLAAELHTTAASAEHLLNSLAAHGLAERHDTAVPTRWSATAPNLAVEMLLLRREEELLRTRGRMGELMRLYRRAQQPAVADLVEVVSGREAIARRWRQLQLGARQRLLVFDRAPHVATQDTELERAVLDRGVRVRSVYETGTVNVPARLAAIRSALSGGEEARLLPELPCKLAVVDDSWAMLPVTAGSELLSAVLVRPSSLFDALVELFETYWQRAVRVPERRPERTERSAAADRRADLLALLCSGYTDDSIARQLGVSARTVQRWVRELMDELGARTRFQAGLQAGRAGLL